MAGENEEGNENEGRTQQDQIDEAVDALQKGTVQPVEDEETSGEEESEEESEETRKAKQTEGEEAEGSEEEVSEGEETEGSGEDDEPVDPRIAKLEAKLEQQESEIERLREEGSDEPEEGVNEPIEFIQDEEQAEALLEDPMKLNEVLNKVLQKGRELAMREVPPAVLESVNRTMTIKERAQEFYKENPELAEHKEFVGYIANSLSSKYKDDPEGLDKLFEETAAEARKRLNIKEKSKERERDRRKSGESARFARKPGAGRQPKPDERNDQQKQIDQMIDELS